MMKKLPAIAAVAALALSPLTQAQTNLTDDTQLLISQIQTDKRAVVLEAMELDDAQLKLFVPIYDEYQKEMKAIYERTGALLNKYASNYGTMTDDAAKDILKDFFKLQQDREKLLPKYAKKMEKQIPPAKVLRFVQIENKLNTLMQMQAARVVPVSQ
jgi:hypothetical protein